MQDSFPKKYYYANHSVFDKYDFLRVYGTVSSKLHLLRTAAVMERQRDTGVSEPDPKWIFETHAYSLLFYWQKTAIYRDIVHHLVKPRHPYNYVEDFSEHGIRYIASPVHVFVCESAQTFHFLLHYMEKELGANANTLARPDYQHVLFVDHQNAVRQNYHVAEHLPPASFFYATDCSQNIREWKRVSEQHGVNFSDFFYSLWKENVEESMQADIERKRALAKEIAEGKRGYLRRAAGPSELLAFLQEQRTLREENSDTHPAAFVFMTTHAFMQWIQQDTLFANRGAYSLNIINDGSFQPFDVNNALSSKDTADLSGRLREVITSQFSTVHIWSSTAFMYLTLILRFQHSQFFQRYLSISMLLLLLSIKYNSDVWYFCVDHMIEDVFFPLSGEEVEEEEGSKKKPLKYNDLLVRSFRLCMSEWQRRRAERDLRMISSCMSSVCEKDSPVDEEKESSSAADGFDQCYYRTHRRPEYIKMVKDLKNHRKACKFLVTDFVKSVSAVLDSSVFVPIYLHSMMRLRSGCSLSLEMFELLTLEGYSSLNGYSMSSKYETSLTETWNQEQDMYPSSSPTSLGLRMEQQAVDETIYLTQRRLDSFLCHPMYRRVQEIPLADPTRTVSELYSSIRTVDTAVGTLVYRDADIVKFKSMMNGRMLSFMYSTAKKQLEQSIYERVATSGYTTAVSAVQNQKGKHRLQRYSIAEHALLPPDDFVQFCGCVNADCDGIFCESLRVALHKLGPIQQLEDSAAVCGQQSGASLFLPEEDPALLPRMIKNADRMISCVESDKRFTESLRLLKYVDLEFDRAMRRMPGELCQLAAFPYQADAPLVIVRAVHVPNEMDVSRLLDFWCPQERTLVLCGDEIEPEFFAANAKCGGRKMNLFTYSLFEMLLDSIGYSTEEDAGPSAVEMFADCFDRVVFLSKCVDADKRARKDDCSSFSSSFEARGCEGCANCQLPGIDGRPDFHRRTMEDSMVESEMSLRFFHRFFRASRKTTKGEETPRHVWIYQPFEDTHVPEYQQLWRLPAYGRIELDWMLAVSEVRGADDLVMKLLWASRVPRERCAFYAHFPESKFQDFYCREHLEADVLVFQKKNFRPKSFGNSVLKEDHEEEKKTKKQQEEDDRAQASFQFVEVFLHEHREMATKHLKKAEEFFMYTKASRPAYFH